MGAPPTGEVANPALFQPVVFYLGPSIKPTVQAALRDLLINSGATPCPLLTSYSAAEPRFDLSRLTHVVTDTLDFPEYSLLRPEGETYGPTADAKGKGKEGEPIGVVVGKEKKVEIVSPAWVTRSYDLQTLQPPRFHSPDRALFFSGTVICTSEFPETDNLAIAGAVEAFGGQFRRELTREVTHLICISEHGVKYEMAMKFGTELGMVVVLPHWFEESLKLAQLVPLDIYRFPSPPFCTTLHDASSSKPFADRLHSYWQAKLAASSSSSSTASSSATPSVVSNTATSVILGGVSPHLASAAREETDSYLRQASSLEGPSSAFRQQNNPFFTSTNPSTTGTAAAPPLAQAKSPIFAGLKVYLASDLGLSTSLERALKGAVEAAGGECWSFGVDGEREAGMRRERARSIGGGMEGEGDAWAKRRVAEVALKESGLVVMRMREGWEYWTAYDLSLPLGTLSYLYHCLSTSSLPSPLSRLLHYPLPSLDGVPEMRSKVITVSNYAGPARDYVRAMIEVLGAKFEGTMGRQTDYVVSASEYGSKVSHARTWSIPLVTHLWLEACLLSWALIPPSLHPSYTLSGSSTSSSSVAETHFTTILGGTGWTRERLREWAEREEVRREREMALRGVEELEREAAEEARRLEENGGEGEGEGEGEGRENGEAEETTEVEVVEAAAQPRSKAKEKALPPPPPPAREQRAQLTLLVDTNMADAEEEEQQPPPLKGKDKKEKKKAVAAEPIDEEDDVEPPVKPASKATKASKADAAPAKSKTKSASPAPAPKEKNSKKKAVPALPDVDLADDAMDVDPKLSKPSKPAPPMETPAKQKKSSKPSASSKRKRSSSLSSAHSSDSDHTLFTSDFPASAHRMTKTFGQVSADNLVAPGARRGARAKADAALASAVKDKNNYEKEMRSSAVKRKSAGGGGSQPHRRSQSPIKRRPSKEESEEERENLGSRSHIEDEDEEEREPVKKVKQKEKKAEKETGKKKAKREEAAEEGDEGDKPKKKKTKKRLSPSGSEDEKEEEEPPRPAKKAKKTVENKALKTVQASAGGAATTQEGGVVSSFDNPPRAKPAPVKSGKVKIISTGLGLDKQSPDIKSLKSLGATWTDHPKDATHLVVKGISRTEKFLCCLPFAPKIVTPAWIDACIAAGRLVDEMPYLLHDEKKERELGTTLAEILARAKKGKLFANKSAFITKSVVPEPAVMSRIISACGGKALTTPPSKVIKNILDDGDDSIVISCANDRKEWDALASKGRAIYAVEAVFVSVLHQDLAKGFTDANRVDPQI
ncbi:hypothetical protein JCM8547_008212 [Rhodosporidiobolus lusitaniae]